MANNRNHNRIANDPNYVFKSDYHRRLHMEARERRSSTPTQNAIHFWCTVDDRFNNILPSDADGRRILRWTNTSQTTSILII